MGKQLATLGESQLFEFGGGAPGEKRERDAKASVVGSIRRREA